MRNAKKRLFMLMLSISTGGFAFASAQPKTGSHKGIDSHSNVHASAQTIGQSSGQASGQPSKSAAPSADALLANWKNAIYTNREHSQITLALVESGSSPLKRLAEVWYKSKTAGESEILMKFKSPASIAGVAFLSLRAPGQSGADQWLYFPAYKKARRLSSHNRDESFLDSDFSNGDISFEYEDAFDIRVTGESKVEGNPVYVLEGHVKASKKDSVPYGREVLYITKGENLNLRSEFYEQSGALVKVLVVSNWKKYGERWSADKIEVENMKTKHRSILSFDSRDLSGTPADRLFTMNELERGH